MTTPAGHSAFNLKFSVYRHFKEHFAVPHPEYGVSCEDAFWDSDRRNESRVVRERWVTLQALSETAGQKGAFLLQVRCSGRVSTVARRVTDRHGRQLEVMAQLVRDAFLVKCIPLYDYTADPLAPTRIAGRCCFVQNSAGKFRVPELHQVLPPNPSGVREQIFTFRFRTPFDGAGGHTYDVGS